MGGAPQQILKSITPQVEEGVGTALKQSLENWFTTSGRSFLKELGPAGEFLSNHLDHYEAYKAGASSRSKAAVEMLHQNPQQLQNFQGGMAMPTKVPVRITSPSKERCRHAVSQRAGRPEPGSSPSSRGAKNPLRAAWR